MIADKHVFLEKNKWFLLAIILIFITFYWYELRPYFGEKSCYNNALYEEDTVLKETPRERTVASKGTIDRLKYLSCVSKKGLEPNKLFLPN